ncbi:unnamed protein product [Hymenolepis diminuta]|uniref:Protein kinase domain-containing protein n=1 Tax=Hymenolepis diminuta TaxID=6216 RepID=A0A0R3SMZ3_HYMDI|nr:unnamed protein product [Hymenolepis diminuta]
MLKIRGRESNKDWKRTGSKKKKSEILDVWSVACILVELKTGQALFRGLNHIDQVKQIMSIVGTPDEEMMKRITSNSAREFIERNYTERRDLKEVFPWASSNLNADHRSRICNNCPHID